MPWVRLDDTFAEHPKVIGLSDGAFRAHVAALCYCNRHLTDGHLPAVFDTHAQELTEAGLWDVTPTGFLLHDYLDYQPSRVQVEEERAKKQAAGQAGGRASARARAQAAAQAKSKPVPVPKPVPKPKTEPLEKPSDLNGYKTDLDKLIEWAGSDVDDGGVTIMAVAKGLPEAAAARVLEGVRGKKPTNRAAYVVQSLKMERELRNENSR